MTRTRIHVHRIGREGEPIVVIDGFHPTPGRLVDEAASTTLTPPTSCYPGLRAPVDPTYCATVGALVAGATRRVFGYTERMAFDRALFSLTRTPTARLALAQRIPHFDDAAPGKLAIVHYLSLRDWGGTRFFRHRATGFETIGPARQRTYLDALAQDFRQHGEPLPGYIDGSTALFEVIGTVSASFNRAVIYRSSLLHCAAIDNGRPLPDAPREGRLTIASFLTAS